MAFPDSTHGTAVADPPCEGGRGIALRSGCDSPQARRLATQDLGRPIRVVVFGGAFFEPAALEFVALLDAHPEVELIAGFCQSRGFDLRSRTADVIRRRRLLAPVVLGAYSLQAALRFVRAPRCRMDLRRRVGRALSRFVTVPDIHAPAVLERVRALEPDLGLVYGAPLLKPQLFEIPTFGTLGIHHGRLPEYRGKKTTFWAMFAGEATAGVTIQQIGAGLDRGQIVCAGEVPTAGRRYGRVAREVQQLGVRLYVDAVVAVKRGVASVRPQNQAASPLYRQPAPGDYLRFWYRQVMRKRSRG